MAKYRCPSCGAAHKDPPATCRLCGYVMDGSVEIPTQSNQAPATVVTKKRGAGSLAIIGVIIVVVLAVGALALHVVSGGSTVNKVVDKIGIKGTPDGWKTVTDPQGGFTVSLPPDAATTSVGFAPADNGQLTGWLATVGEAPQVDTQIYVLYGKIHPNPGESAEDTVSRLGDAKMAADGGFIESRTQTTFQGYPAIQYTINRISFQGVQGYENAMLFLKGDELYVVETLSIYPGDPANTEFNQVLSSLQFTS
jgi:rubredoxin